VIAALRARHVDGREDTPQVDRLEMGGRTVAMLQWQSEPWIRLRDMPKVLPAVVPAEKPWRQIAGRLFRL
jgi:hypothetical protein